MTEPSSGLFEVNDVYRRVGAGTWPASSPEFYASWSPAPSGTPFSIFGYEGIIFTASSTLSVSTVGGGKDVEYVVVAGGGGGGKLWGGGGGAGGYRAGIWSNVIDGTYSIQVGAGGAGTTNPSGARGSKGGNSALDANNPLGIFAEGGGGGGGGPNPTASGEPGGSGGGGGGGNPSFGQGGAGNTPPTSPPQGNPGAGTFVFNSPNSGGGGGGAGQPGQPASWINWSTYCGPDSNNLISGNAQGFTSNSGGNGVDSSITGTVVHYAAGGGGAARAGDMQNYSGRGGGPLQDPGPTSLQQYVGGSAYNGPTPHENCPNFWPNAPYRAINGMTNRGGGGGAYAGSSPTPFFPLGGSGNGGSGVVIIRWQVPT